MICDETSIREKKTILRNASSLNGIFQRYCLLKWYFTALEQSICTLPIYVNTFSS